MTASQWFGYLGETAHYDMGPEFEVPHFFEDDLRTLGMSQAYHPHRQECPPPIQTPMRLIGAALLHQFSLLHRLVTASHWFAYLGETAHYDMGVTLTEDHTFLMTTYEHLARARCTTRSPSGKPST